MQDLSTASEKRFHWMQPETLRRRFELRSANQQIATLEFRKVLGSLAVATSASGQWTFKRTGFFKPRITVRKADEESDLAVFHPNWLCTSGALLFADGRAFNWRVANFWVTQFAWVDRTGRASITYQSGVEDKSLGDLFKNQARVDIEPSARAAAEVPLLVTLGWYLIILQREDSAATMAAVS
jgi:hypothetical protein